MVVSGQGTREANLRYHKNKPFYCFVKAPKREKTVFFFDFLKEFAEKDSVRQCWQETETGDPVEYDLAGDPEVRALWTTMNKWVATV